MMIDATVAPKVGFISPFGTTVCNVNHSNATLHLPPEAGARYERTLEAVRYSALFGAGLLRGSALAYPLPQPHPLLTVPPPRPGAVSDSRLRRRKRHAPPIPMAPVPSLYPPLHVKVLREWDIQKSHRAADGACGVALAPQIVRHERFASPPLLGLPIARADFEHSRRARKFLVAVNSAIVYQNIAFSHSLAPCSADVD